MKNWFLAIQIALSESRTKLWALTIGIAAWLIVSELISEFLGTRVLNAIVYALVGWYWLGSVVIPWIEHKLEDIFEL